MTATLKETLDLYKINAETSLLDKDILIEELKLHQEELLAQNEQLAKTQIELEYSRNKYFDLFEFAPIAYFSLDCNGLIIDVNKAASKMLDIERNQLRSRVFSRYLASHSHLDFLLHRQDVLNSDEQHSCEVQVIRKDGTTIDAQVDSKSIYNEGKGEKEILTFLTDISVRRNTEIMLKTQQSKIFSLDRADTVSEMGARMANELNSPLAIVGNYINGCLLRLSPENDSSKLLMTALKKASSALDTTFAILQKMKNFNTRRSLSWKKTNINDFINATIALFNFEISSYPVRIYFNPNHECEMINIDQDQMQQVLLNLTRNALEAMKDAGTIQPRIFIECEKANESGIEIRVIDNGPGVPEALKPNLLKERCTSKTYGTGIGLVVCKRIVEAHGGTFSYDPDKDHGYFSLQLPLNLTIS